jgi:hypothetical protein
MQGGPGGPPFLWFAKPICCDIARVTLLMAQQWQGSLVDGPARSEVIGDGALGFPSRNANLSKATVSLQARTQSPEFLAFSTS